jgi:myo-inositol-1(or 4)-monophosphatase
MIPVFASTVLQTALKKGGEVLLSHIGQTAQATVKESISSVVTEADLASEQAILKVLDGAPEAYNVISEEAGYLDRKSEFTWVVDPLDGTSNFAAGLPWFGVIIALFHKDTPVIGGMYLPTDEKLYLAKAGEGATLNEKAMKLLHSLPLSDHLVAYSFDFSEDAGKTRSEMDMMARLSRSVRNIRSTNSLVDFCYVAEGKLGATLNQQTKIWDIAVPWLLIRELGGSVSDIQGNDIRFDLSQKALSQNYTILASGPGLQQKILDTIHSK